jgi:hypothetical protein
MISGRSFAVFSVAFAAAYAVLYVISIQYNLALFTYHPASEEFHWLVKPAADQPAMYWYGWLATSALGALAFAMIVASLPATLTARLWPGWSWAVPLAVMLFFGYILRGYFIG